MASRCDIIRNLLLLVCCVALAAADVGINCRPGIVTNLQLSPNSTLSWDPPLNENCEIQHYLVHVSILQTEEEFEYVATDTSIDVGHLTPCLRYYFQVYQVTIENVTGSFAAIHTVTPPPSEANLALDYLSVIPDGRNVRLEWSLEKEWIPCAQRYRLVIVNEPSQTVSDLYTTTPTATVVGLTGCATYTFTVRALFTLEGEGPPSAVRHVAPPANTSVPVLEDIELKHTGATLTFGLQRYERNRCPITSINVNGGRYFNVTFPVTDQENRHSFKASLSRLESNTLYYLQVSATNSAATTRPLQLAVQTLE